MTEVDDAATMIEANERRRQLRETHLENMRLIGEKWKKDPHFIPLWGYVDE